MGNVFSKDDLHPPSVPTFSDEMPVKKVKSRRNLNGNPSLGQDIPIGNQGLHPEPGNVVKSKKVGK